MINVKKISKILCLSILFTGISSANLTMNSYASNSTFEFETDNITSSAPIVEETTPIVEEQTDNSSSSQNQNVINSGNSSGSDWQEELLKPEDFLPEEQVTIQDFENKILEKMLEVVSLLQTFAKPFCILLFIICGLGVLMSIVFGTNKQKMFLLGLILSVITYVGVVFAPNLVLFFANWLSF